MDQLEVHLHALTHDRAVLFASLKHLSTDKLWQQPAHRRWSAGEHLEHLRITLQLFRRFIRLCLLLTGSIARKRADLERLPSVVESIFDQPDYIPRRAAPLSSPRKRNASLMQLQDEFTREQVRFEKLLRSYPISTLYAVRFPFPPYGTINVIQAVYALWRHEAHHGRAVACLTKIR